MRTRQQAIIANNALLILFIVVFLSSCAPKTVVKGKASFYADSFQGKKTANGEQYRKGKLTAAHKTLPFGTKVKVTNLNNGKTVQVRINDRGPFVKGRIIDLSKRAARQIDLIERGVGEVKIEYKLKKK